MCRKASLSFLALAVCGPSLLRAAPLTEAKVTKIINEVKLVDPTTGDHNARLNDIVRDEVALTTGIKSRSELLFQDDTLTRIGPESYFSFKSGTRDMTLQKGTLLLQVPKGIGGAKIHTAAVTAAITGTTIMMEYVPNHDLKVLVLEGSLRLSVNGTFGDSLLLLPGKMVIMPPNAKHIPDPVTVDLKKVVSTSTLVKMHGKKTVQASLPSLSLIDKEIEKQDRSKSGKKLVDTNLVILGKGTNALLAPDNLMAQLARATDASELAAQPSPAPTIPPGPEPADVGPHPLIDPDGQGLGQHTDVTYGDHAHPISVPLVINRSQDWTSGGGIGRIGVISNDSVTVNSTLKVSDVGPSHGHGQISIDSGKTTGTAITISSSAQLLALLNAGSPNGGMIKFTSAGGDINMDGMAQADSGTIEIDNNGASGVVNLNNATLNANTIKVGALGANGTLNVGSGTISADSIIKLYAGGSNGTVNFTQDVTLNGNSVKTISGDTVTIFNGKTVTVNGPAPANVFTNHPNYTGWGGNASTTGTFAGQGANTHPLNGGPGY